MSSINDDIDLDNIVEELANRKLAAYLYAIEYPAFHVIIKGSTRDLILKTLKSVAAQTYPLVDVTILTDESFDVSNGFEKLRSITFHKPVTPEKTGAFLKNAAENPKCFYYVLIPEGTEYLPHTFFQVRNIFKRFVEIHWLIGTPVFRNEMNVQLPVDLAMRRINKNMYLKQIAAGGHSNIDPASAFLTKTLLAGLPENLLYNDKINVFENLWRNIFEYTEPYFSSIYCCYSTVVTESRKSSSLAEWCFRNNIPYLRFFFKEKMNLNPIVRFEHRTNSYYLSEY